MSAIWGDCRIKQYQYMLDDGTNIESEDCDEVDGVTDCLDGEYDEGEHLDLLYSLSENYRDSNVAKYRR